MSVPVESQENLQTETKNKEAEYNFAQLRKELANERQARLELEARAKELETERASRASARDDDEDDAPYVDRRSLKRHLDGFSKDIDAKIDKKAEEKARILLEQERQTNFVKQNSDFHQVLTQENLQKFAEKHPEIAENMLEMPDTFARQKLLYQNIKALGVNRKEEPKQSIQDIVNQNRKSAYYQPTQSGATPPYANNGDFSQTGQQNAYKKMQELIKNRRAG